MVSKPITWFFGAGSKWSQKFISHLEGEVLQFSRFGDKELKRIPVDFSPFGIQEWLYTIEDLPLPTRIIFNINTGGVAEQNSFNIDNINQNYVLFNKWWMDNSEQLFLKYTLLDYLIEERNFQGEVCYITSQIAKDTHPRWNNLLLYKSLRAVDYELIWNMRNRGVNAYGVCPAANTRPLEWAEFIANYIQTDEIGKEEWLYGVSETNDSKLNMVKWELWKK